MRSPLKKHNTIGCCGIDCGLCPRFYTKGDSRCPGCGGPDFPEKHPSCGFVTCCFIKKGFEVCSDCSDYPCNRFDSEKGGHDSFVTHRKVFSNLGSVKSNGIEDFIARQTIRMNILKDFITHYDEGRSKSFFCISCALLPLDELKEIHRSVTAIGNQMGIREKNRDLRDKLLSVAGNLGIDLKLIKKLTDIS
jgi:hypothetical protein